MKLRLPLHLVSAVLAVFATGICTQSVFSESICINFGSVAMPNSDALAGVDAVAVASKNWNNALNNSGTIADLIDSTHKGSGASITWKGGAVGVGATGENTTVMADGNKQMMGSYLDDKNGGSSSFNISNIGYLAYDVYIYCSFTGGYQYAPKSVNGEVYMGSGSTTVKGNSVWGQTDKNAKEGKLAEGGSGNYLRITTQTGASLDILGDVIADGWSRGGVAGIMIVNTAGTAFYSTLAGGSSTEWTAAPWKDSAGASVAWADSVENAESSASFNVTGETAAGVTIQSAVTANGIFLNSGSLNITGGSLNLVKLGLVSVEENSVLSIASTLTVDTGILVKKGKGTLTLTGEALKYGNGFNIEEGVVNATGAMTLKGGKTTTVAGEFNLGGNLTINTTENHHLVITETGKVKITGNFTTNYSPTLNNSGILEVSGTLQARGGGTTRFELKQGSTTKAGTFELNYNGKVNVAGRVETGFLTMTSSGGALVVNDKGSVEAVKLRAAGGGNTIDINKGGYLNVTGDVSSENYDNNSFVLGSGGAKSVLTVNGGRVDALGALLYMGGTAVADSADLKLVVKNDSLVNLYGISNSLNSSVITVTDSRLNIGAGGIKALETGSTGKISFDNSTLGALDSWKNEKLAFEIGSKGLTVDTEQYDAAAGAGNGTGKTITLDGVLKSVNTDTAGTTVGGLTKKGAGTLVLNGDNSEFTGAIKVEGGGLTTGHVNALGSGAVTMNGTDMSLDMGGLALSNNVDITGNTVIRGASQFAGNLTLNSGDLTGDAFNLAAGKSYLFKGGSIANNLTGAGSFTKSTTADLALSGTSDYTGATEVQAGRLMVSGAVSSSTVTVRSGSGLFLTGAGSVGGNIILDAGAALDAGNNMVLADAQTVTAAAGASLKGNMTLGSGSTLNVSGGLDIDGVLTLDGGTFSWSNVGGMKIKGIVMGANSTANALGMGGGNTYSIGSEGIKGTVLEVGNATLGALADWTATATLALTDSTSGVTLNTQDQAGAGHTITLEGVVSGNGKVTKTGAGSLVLSSANTYTGDTVVRQGTLYLGDDRAIGQNGKLVLTSGATLAAYEKSVNLVNNVELGQVGDSTYNVSFGVKDAAELLTLGGQVNILAAGVTLTTLSDTELSGQVASNTSALTKRGAGTLTFSGGLSGVQTIDLAEGALGLVSETALNVVKTLNMSSGTTLNLGNVAGGSGQKINVAGSANMKGVSAYSGSVTMSGIDSRLTVDGDFQAGQISFRLGLKNASLGNVINLVTVANGTARITGTAKDSIILDFDVDYLNTQIENGGVFHLFSQGLTYNQGTIRNNQRQLIMLDESQLSRTGAISWSKITLSGTLMTAEEASRLTTYVPSGLSSYLGAAEGTVTIGSGVNYDLDGYDNYNLTAGKGTLVYLGHLTGSENGLYVADYADITGKAGDHSTGAVVLANNANSYGNGTNISGSTLIVDLSLDKNQDLGAAQNGSNMNVGVLGSGRVEAVAGTVSGSKVILRSYGDQSLAGVGTFTYGNEFYLSSSSVLEQQGSNVQIVTGDIVSGFGENVLSNTGSKSFFLKGNITQNEGGRLILESKSTQGNLVLDGENRILSSEKEWLGIQGGGMVSLRNGYTVKAKGINLKEGTVLSIERGGNLNMGQYGAAGTGTIYISGGRLGSVSSWNSDVAVSLGAGENNVIDTVGANVRLNRGVTGLGGFVKNGSGTLYIYNHAERNAEGLIDVKQGRLILLGGDASQRVAGMSEYVLNGDLTLSSGKGASLEGMIDANGHNVTFGDGTNFYMSVSEAEGLTGYIRNADTIAFGTGTRLHVNVLDDSWVTGTNYTVFSSNNGITGAGNLELALEEDFAFVDVSLDRANDKEIGLILTRRGEAPGGTGDGTNMGSVGSVVSSLVNGVLADNTELTGKLLQHMQTVSKMTATEYQTYINDLGNSASSFYTALSAQVQDATQHINSVRNRVELLNPVMYDDWTEGGIYNVWAGGINHYRDVKSNSESPGYEMTSWGGELGCAIPLSQTFMIGVGFAYTFSDVQVKDGWGNNDSDTYNVDVFARYRKDALTITGVLTGGFTNTEFHRNHRLKDEVFRANSSTDGNQFMGTVEAGYDFYLNEEKSWILQPLVNLTAGRAKLDGLSETGELKNAGLMIGSQSYNMFSAGIGAKIAYQYKNRVSDLPGRVELKAMYVNDMGDVDFKVNGRFIGAPQDGFDLKGVSNERSSAIVSAGWIAPISAYGQFFVDAGCEFRKDQNGVNTTVGFSFQF